MAGIRRYRALSRPARKITLRALGHLPKTRASLRRHGYIATLHLLENTESPTVEPGELTDLAHFVDRVARLRPPAFTCLERSLVVSWLAGDGARIVRGVAPGTAGEPHRFHAWVEVDGLVLNDSQSVKTEYLPLTSTQAEAADPDAFD